MPKSYILPRWVQTSHLARHMHYIVARDKEIKQEGNKMTGMEKPNHYYVSGVVDESAMTRKTDGRYARATHHACPHRHRTRATAWRCAAQRRRTNGAISAYAVGRDGYYDPVHNVDCS